MNMERVSKLRSQPATQPSSGRNYNSPVDPLEFSRYARQLVAARPELRGELERSNDLGWTRGAMQTFLREHSGGDEGALHSRVRMLRQRVVLRTMAPGNFGTSRPDEMCGAEC